MKILVVDDEAPIRDWIVYSIEREGNPFHVVGAAKSGKEAYEMVIEHKPNVIITDIKMPGIDGIELMQMVRKIQPYIVFIILTNYAEFTYAKKAITYGATEYLLKSELRSADLVDILNKVYGEQLKLTNSKKSEILSSGYVDLYNLYQNIEDKDYHISFWQNLGMNIDMPYCILGVLEDMDFNQREILIEIAKETLVYYFNIALRDQGIYIVIQENSKVKLEKTVEKFSKAYFEITDKNIAIGQVQENLQTFLKAVDEVEKTLSANFFNTTNKILYYENLLGLPKINRNVIINDYRKILSFIFLNQYNQAIEALNIWFGNFSNLNVNDILWAKDMSIKMVISIEEKFYQMNSEHVDSGIKTRQLNSVNICKEISIKMVKKMAEGVNGPRSKIIDEALDFIHKNFNKDISLVTVANHVYRSPEYFSRLFKNEVGVNFSVYLMMHRLDYAQKLLRTTNLQISEIAYKVGYTNPGYFSRIYKKYMGMTPEEYRCQENIKRSK